MEIGTFARNTEQVKEALSKKPDFIDLRMDLDHSLNFGETKHMLLEADVKPTLHLPSSPDWKPLDLAREIIPYIDIGSQINADLVTFHSTLSSIFYDDEDIDQFLENIPLACDAAKENGIQLAVETLGIYYTELMLLSEKCPEVKIALDIGHAQIMAHRNRALGIIQEFQDSIAMVNVHDNKGALMIDEVLELRKKGNVPPETVREIAVRYDEHLPIGGGKIEFQPIFKSLKEVSYDGKFLMMCKDPSKFESEREQFERLWLKA
ncbi:MAG: TIM barrel protein [Candidatus Lokiarchaeota archaeon]|nr:TIM barrel protein [Candidatus Lokiarchaeota archaeon]